MNHTYLSYQIIDHTADLGIIITGKDEKNLFIHAANAMTDIMVKGDITTKTVSKEVFIKGEDFPDLMVKWLGEILYFFNGERLVLHSIEITSISPIMLSSTLILSGFDPKHHQVEREINAVTYHQIFVDKVSDEWQARIIFDI